MKKIIIVGTFLGMVAPLTAQASCESAKADISQKIINNGVLESGFSLEIVPNDQVSQVGGQVVGHCENDSQKIVYIRHAEGEAGTNDVSTPTENPPAQPVQ
ncbi:DUF1161 domain-containing protein [Brenneria rubrifaciens]|uniref:DUF1161 domain-containing protein n=1 Tax=Brenneria rubrifaciens TaxID=55213 RepID=A0A4P8QQ93_9GAMM|nr:DUF1161 domain-containing protein [Brenneria rubrifaciens]QCR08616.1 DUF1161 domain-containing protein [Brenneria rubrifaciens]